MKYHGLNKSTFKYKATSSFTALAIFVQAMQWASYGIIINAAMPSPYAFAMQDDSLKEKLRVKYKTDDPYDNYQGTEKRDKVLGKTYEQSGRLLENEIIEKYYAPEQPTSEPMDFSKYDDGKTFQERFNGSVDTALSTPKLIKLPTAGANDSINMNQGNRAGMEVTKDADGKLTFTPKEVSENVTVENLSLNEIATAEYDNTNVTNESSAKYGDEDGFYEEGRKRFSELQTTNTGDALAYKTLMDAQDQNPQPIIHSDNPLLTNSINSKRDARDGEGIWGQDCTEITSTRDKETHYPLWEEKRCEEPNKENLKSCQIERDIVFPIRFGTVGGTLPLKPFIKYINESTLSISFESGNNSIYDARSYNDEQDVVSFGKHDCRVYDKQITFEIAEGFTVKKAYRVGGLTDDVYKEFINGNVSVEYRTNKRNNWRDHQSVYANIPDAALTFPRSYYSNFPVDALLAYNTNARTSSFLHCEEENGSYGNKDVTAAFKPVNGLIDLSFLLAIGGRGELQMEFIIEFDQPIKPTITYTQKPEMCATMVGWVEPGTNTNGSGSVEPEPGDAEPGSGGAGGPLVDAETNKSFCTFDNWTCISADNLGLDQTVLDTIPGMYPSDSNNVCLEINAAGYQCDPLEGEIICTTDRDNVETCFTYDDVQAMPDSCSEVALDSLCYEKSQECVEGWFDEASDRCYLFEKTYECDVGLTTMETVTNNTNLCAGAIPCLGNECDFGEKEENDDFAQSAAYLEMVSGMAGETTCTDPQDPSTCTVFDGERKFCSWETTGLGTDCCEAPEGVNLFDYMQLAAYSHKVAQLSSSAYSDWVTSNGEAIDGALDSAYDTLKEPIEQGVNDYIIEPITEAYNSFAGTTAGTAAPATTSAGGVAGTAEAGGAMASMQQSMMQGASDFLGETFGSEVQSAIFEDVAGDAAGEVVVEFSSGMQTAGSVLVVLMYAYMIYMMIKLLMTLVTACEDEEMDMGMRIFQRQCFKVDNSYCNKKVLGACLQKRQDWCCYNSALARIVMEQAYPLLGKDTLECKGLSMAELTELDWDQIDLTEYINMMVGSGLMPSEECSTEECLNSKQIYNPEGRATGDEKAADFQEQEWNQRAKEIRANMDPEQIDCSVLPRPASCNLDNEGG
jgi:conjugal transfer mating pair stabilization protein TraN